MSTQKHGYPRRAVNRKITELQHRIARLEWLRDNLKHGVEMVAWFNHEIGLLQQRLRADEPERLFDESFKG